ncbi:MAG: carbohydrate binding domain-containing protein [Bacillota bacterium]
MPVRKKAGDAGEKFEKMSAGEVVDHIIVEPVPITLGEKVKIKYDGPLSGEGAEKIYLRMGFGRGAWKEVADVPMRRDKNGKWSASVEAKDSSCLNFCFHDGADHWDNNDGRNWTYEIHTGAL